MRSSQAGKNLCSGDVIGVYAVYLGNKQPYSLDNFTKYCIESLLNTNFQRIVVFCTDPDLASSLFKSSKLEFVKVPDYLRPSRGPQGIVRTIWSSFIFPFYLRSRGIKVCLSPVAEGPLIGKTTTITTIHDIIPLCHRQGSLSYYYYRYVVKRLAHRSVMVFTPSEFSAVQINEKFNLSREKIKIVYGVIDDDFFINSQNYMIKKRPLINNTNLNYILYVGSFYEYKNVKVIVQSLKYISETICLLLIGRKDHWVESGLEAFAISENVANRVLLISDVSNEELRFYYKNALALINVSLCEGFGLQVAEAMACGCPVIVSENTALSEIASDGGIHVNSRNPKAVSGAVNKLNSSPEYRSILIERGRRRVELFKRESFLNILVTELNELAVN